MGKVFHFLKSLKFGKRIAVHELCRFSEPQTQAVMAGVAGMLRLSHPGEQLRCARLFEKEFSKRFAVRHARGVNSGTTAIYLALKALDIGPGQEVVTVANTFVSTITAICETGATVRFADIDAATGMMDRDSLAAAITEKTAAVVPVHMYGAMADMERIMVVAQRFGLKVVEDACQAVGARQHGKYAGAWGDAGCFSFHNTKLVGAPADGGMVVTNSQELYDRVCCLADPDWQRALDHPQARIPARLPAISLPILKARLESLSDNIRHREAQFQRYRESLAGVDAVRFLAPEKGVAQSYRNAVLLCPKPKALMRAIQRKGIFAEQIYPQSALFVQSIEARGGPALPRTRHLVSNHIALPLGRQVSPEIQDVAGAVIRKFFKKRF